FAGLDVSRAALRAALRASASRASRAWTTVLRLPLASFTRSVVEAAGSALSAASARSRASLGALRRYLRLRRPPRARLLDDRRREGCGSKTAGGVSAVRSSGARTAPRTAAAVLGWRVGGRGGGGGSAGAEGGSVSGRASGG